MLNKRGKRLLKYLTLPVRLLTHGIYYLVPHNKKNGQIIVAIGVIFTGSWLASVHQEIVPHFIWDGIAYTIHGFGCAPLIERILTAAE